MYSQHHLPIVITSDLITNNRKKIKIVTNASHIQYTPTYQMLYRFDVHRYTLYLEMSHAHETNVVIP